MNKLPAPRPLLVDSPSDSGFATTSWGEQARPRLRAAETEGRLPVLFYRAPAGFGPPRHLHRQDDEIFLIEQGAIALWTPHECRTAGPGDVVMLPKVMPHTWRAYGDDPIRFQVTVTPGEFETFFERIVERKLTLADQAELVEVASSSGMDIIGPPLRDEEGAPDVGGRRRLGGQSCATSRISGRWASKRLCASSIPCNIASGSMISTSTSRFSGSPFRARPATRCGVIFPRRLPR